MQNISLLDCTLRDGGYLNDWRFGRNSINEIIRGLECSNVETIEVGFLRDERYDENRCVFHSIDQVKEIIRPKKKNVKYAVMCEVLHALALEKISVCDEESPEIIRVIVWKTKHDKAGNVVDALQEGYEYCKGIAEKGYKLCVQPARVDQYTDEEFVNMIKLYSTLSPFAIYVVDSWGTCNTEQLMHYMHIADKVIPEGVHMGYHGHNNMMQAFGVAQEIIREKFHHAVIIDASIYGIGRGAGNLNLEIIANYMNEGCGSQYEISPLINLYGNYIQDIYEQEKWGYSIPFYLTAKFNCNPNYARYYAYEKKMTDQQILKLLQSMDETEKVLYSRELAETIYLRDLKKI